MNSAPANQLERWPESTTESLSDSFSVSISSPFAGSLPGSLSGSLPGSLPGSLGSGPGARVPASGPRVPASGPRSSRVSPHPARPAVAASPLAPAAPLAASPRVAAGPASPRVAAGPASESAARPVAAPSASASPPARGARASAAKRASAVTPPPVPLLTSRRREVQGILLLTLGLFLALSAGSLVLGDGNLMGPVGRWVASAFYAGFGTETLVLSGGLLFLAVRYLCGLRLRPSLRLSSGLVGVGLATAALLHLIGQWLGRPGRLHGMPLGGALGEYTAEVLIGLVGTAGTLLLAGLGLLLSLLFLTELSVRSGLLASVQSGRRGFFWVRQQIRSLLARRIAAPSIAAAGRAAPPSPRPSPIPRPTSPGCTRASTAPG